MLYRSTESVTKNIKWTKSKNQTICIKTDDFAILFWLIDVEEKVG